MKSKLDLKQIAIVALITVTAVMLTQSLSQSAKAASGGGPRADIVVLGIGLPVPGDEANPHVVILDRETSEVWAYSQFDRAPKRLGIFRPGHAISAGLQ